MKRSDFIRSIAGFLGLAVLPAGMVRQYRRVYLLQSFVRGFRFNNGPQLLEKMLEGDMLELVREPYNTFDDRAIALHFNQHKIGYIPREDNDMLSKLMDAEVVQLNAEITHLNKAAKAWENVHIAVYVLKETTGDLPAAATYLTQLETPHYRTVKLSAERVVHVYFYAGDEEEVLDAGSFYDTLMIAAGNNNMPDILHKDFQSGFQLQKMIEEGRVVINRNRLPGDLKGDSLTEAVSKNVIALDSLFDEQGYVVANVNRAAGLSGRIEKVVSTFDRSGRLFYEVQFL